MKETTRVRQSSNALSETETDGWEIPRRVGEGMEVAPEVRLISSGGSLDEGVMRGGEKQAGGPGNKMTMARSRESGTKRKKEV